MPSGAYPSSHQLPFERDEQQELISIASEQRGEDNNQLKQARRVHWPAVAKATGGKAKPVQLD
jgi:hypothetical protein